MSEVEDMQQWQSAQAYVNLLGEIPSSFTIAARSLKTDSENGLKKMGDQTWFQIGRLLKSSTVDAVLNGFIKTYKPFLPDISSAEQLARSIPPLDLAGIIASLFYHKRAKKLVDPEEWSYILPFLARDIDIAVAVGLTIPNLGVAKSLMVIGGRYLSLGPFQMHDKKGFPEYRRYLKGRNFIFDPAWEISRWGCHTGHVTSTMYQNFGLGIPAVDGLATGSAYPLEQAPKEKVEYPIWLISVWVKSLIDSGKQPDMPHKPAYFPDQEMVDLLENFVSPLRTSTSGISKWLDAASDELEA